MLISNKRTYTSHFLVKFEISPVEYLSTANLRLKTWIESLSTAILWLSTNNDWLRTAIYPMSTNIGSLSTANL
jgi:hypothetical protein